MLDQITPVVLTLDEEPNIGRCLERLRWALEVVVVDSGSTDRTLDIARSFPGVRVVSHPFEGFAAQWEWALRHAGIETQWVLALDADYIVPERLVEEISALDPATAEGARVSFTYAVHGLRLRGSLYPDLIVLFRRDRVRILHQGHNQLATVDGRVIRLRERIIHDDRKPMRRWLDNQLEYARLEAVKLRSASWRRLGLADRVRTMRVVAPFVVPFFLLFAKGLVLDGKAGWHYVMQRTLAEAILSLTMLDADLREL